MISNLLSDFPDLVGVERLELSHRAAFLLRGHGQAQAAVELLQSELTRLRHSSEGEGDPTAEELIEKEFGQTNSTEQTSTEKNSPAEKRY